MNKLSEAQKSVLRALADNDLKTCAAAKALYYSYNTILYHIKEIKNKTGMDPRCFWDLVKLLEGVRRDEN